MINRKRQIIGADRCQMVTSFEILMSMWVWTNGFVDATDHDTWRIIGRETLKSYQICGMEYLGGLSRHQATVRGRVIIWKFFFFQSGQQEPFVQSGRGSTTSTDTRRRRKIQLYQSDGFSLDLSGASIAEVVSAIWAGSGSMRGDDCSLEVR